MGINNNDISGKSILGRTHSKCKGLGARVCLAGVRNNQEASVVFVCLLSQSFHRHLPSSYVPSLALGTEEIMWINSDECCPHGPHSFVEKTDNKPTNS